MGRLMDIFNRVTSEAATSGEVRCERGNSVASPPVGSYRLVGKSSTAEMDPAIFAMLLLAASSAGWKGAPPGVISHDGSEIARLSGRFVFDEGPAKLLAKQLSKRMLEADIDPTVKDIVRPLVRVASEGAFTLHAS